jgi:hypothetical protein
MPFNPEQYRTQLDIAKIAIWTRNKNCANNPELPDQVTLDPGDGTLWTSPAAGATGGPAGAYTETFKDTALAYVKFDPFGEPSITNGYTLQALADQIYKDYTAWRQLSFDEVFAGVIAAMPNGIIDETIIDYNALEILTRVLSFPLTTAVQEFGHFDYQRDCSGTALPCHYYYGPPALCCTTTATQSGPSGSALVTATIMYLCQYKLCLEDGRLVERFVQYVPLCNCPGPSALPGNPMAAEAMQQKFRSVNYKGGM